ncbi:YraN family protein [Patescibacteria group bacterium]
MTTKKQLGELGARGEEAVAQLLQQKGFKIIARNVHSRWGELDIIAFKGGVTHIIEVKTRKSTAFGGVEAALSRKKLRKMRKTAFEIKEKRLVRLSGSVQFDFAAVQQEENRFFVQFFWNIGLDDLP